MGHPDVIIQDLPGIYSLSPYTLEEVVSRTYLVKERPDAILNMWTGPTWNGTCISAPSWLNWGSPW